MNTILNFVRKAAPLGAGALFAGMALPAGAQTLSTLRTPVNSAIAKSAMTSTATPNQIVHIAVSLNPPNPAAFQAYANSVADPASPNFRKFLTPAQVGTMFGPSTDTFQAVITYLSSQGFKIRLAPQSHLAILADGTIAQASAAFHTTFKNYHSNIANDKSHVNYFAFSSPLQVPSTIAPSILTVTGLENRTTPIPRLKKVKKQSSSPAALTPAQVAVLYDTLPFHTAGMFGQGRTVAVSSFGGFSLTNVPLFYSQFGLQTPSGGAGSNIVVETVGGGQGSTTPNVEADLDIQMVLSQSPLCNLVIYDSVNDPVACYTQEASDNTADILTESYGWILDVASAEAAHNAHLQMSLQGMTYMLASGDSGTDLGAGEGFTYGDYDPEVTDVGGTVASFTANGTRTNEVAWNGSGGGWDTEPAGVPFNVLAPYQVGTGVPTTINFRLVPDVALVAAGLNGPGDPGAYFFFTSNALDAEDGTSFASPVFAGGLANAEEFLVSRNYFTPTSAGKMRFGRINDLFYKQNGRSDVWFDITSGSNGVLPNGAVSNAGIGWDFCDGWGAIDFSKFANVLISKPPVTVNASSVGIYQAMGVNGTGIPANLAVTDNLYYTVASIPNPVGAIAAVQTTFNLTTTPSNLAVLGLTLVDTGPLGVSGFTYLKNVKTGAFDLVNTAGMTGSNATVNVNINMANYVSSTNQVTMVVRGVLPPRLGTNFTFKVNQATLLETFNANAK